MISSNLWQFSITPPPELGCSVEATPTPRKTERTSPAERKPADPLSDPNSHHTCARGCVEKIQNVPVKLMHEVAVEVPQAREGRGTGKLAVGDE